MEEIYENISCCENNHPLCDGCWHEMNGLRCPICRSDEDRYTNYPLMHILKKILKPCSIDTRCTFKGSPKQYAQHIADCQYKKINCPFCYRQTTVVDIVAHTETECMAKFERTKNSTDLFGVGTTKRHHKYLILPPVIIFVQKTDMIILITCIQTDSKNVCVEILYSVENDRLSMLLQSNGNDELSNGCYSQIKVLNSKVSQWSDIIVMNGPDKKNYRQGSGTVIPSPYPIDIDENDNTPQRTARDEHSPY
jgi:hypothetical protein